jgi:ribosome-binding factor A
MDSRKRSQKKMLESCDDLGPEDGIDPRLEAREKAPKVTNRKALQLCGQVARTLNGVLAGESSDERLRDLVVEAVVPAPNSSRLLVTLTLTAPARAEEVGLIEAQLRRAQGRLRREVAAAIHRKKVPELTFRLIPPPEATP